MLVTASAPTLCGLEKKIFLKKNPPKNKKYIVSRLFSVRSAHREISKYAREFITRTRRAARVFIAAKTRVSPPYVWEIIARHCRRSTAEILSPGRKLISRRSLISSMQLIYFAYIAVISVSSVACRTRFRVPCFKDTAAGFNAKPNRRLGMEIKTYSSRRFGRKTGRIPIMVAGLSKCISPDYVV